ncbi:hypothetical protein [Azospirillum brasilense]|uniref:hypothetical protein n=1 Tax=Azospirillum brasilense TaxID=192 RepID=UPI0013B38E05|nr:hypothetical protein [Azospirillum brasilense]
MPPVAESLPRGGTDDSTKELIRIFREIGSKGKFFRTREGMAGLWDLSQKFARRPATVARVHNPPYETSMAGSMLKLLLALLPLGASLLMLATVQ